MSTLAATPRRPFTVALEVGRAHIVAIAALGCFTFSWFLTGERRFDLAAICALDWFLVNFVNRAVDLAEDRANGLASAPFMERWAGLAVPAAFGTLLVSLVALAPLAPALVPWRVAFHLLGLAYNYRLLPTPRGRVRIKQLYFWKNTASAAGFLITLFAFPLAATSGRALQPAGIAALAGFFLLFEISYEILYDLRDAPGDAAAGVRTYPVVHGERIATRIVDALLAASAAILLAAWAAGWLRWAHAVLVVAPALQLVLYKRWMRRGIAGRDCVTITWIGAALLAAYHGWVALGLPGS